MLPLKYEIEVPKNKNLKKYSSKSKKKSLDNRSIARNLECVLGKIISLILAFSHNCQSMTRSVCMLLNQRNI